MTLPDWLRHHAPWLLGALVVGVLALYLPYHDVHKVAVRHNPDHALDAGPGQWITFDGARWRLLSLQPDVAPLKHPRSDAQVIAATFEVTLAGGTRKDLGKCLIRLADRRGRYWSDSIGYTLLARPVNVPDTCDGSGLGPDLKPLPQRKMWQFKRFFLVPRTLDPASLRAEIRIPQARFETVGNYARLLPPDAH